MSIIWWTLYILGALTIFVAWTQIMALIGVHLKAHRDKVGGNSLGMTRKDIESLIRMEIKANLNNLEVSRTTYPGLGGDKIELKLKEDK